MALPWRNWTSQFRQLLRASGPVHPAPSTIILSSHYYASRPGGESTQVLAHSATALTPIGGAEAGICRHDRRKVSRLMNVAGHVFKLRCV
jgi:hypothetical protein